MYLFYLFIFTKQVSYSFRFINLRLYNGVISLLLVKCMRASASMQIWFILLVPWFTFATDALALCRNFFKSTGENGEKLQKLDSLQEKKTAQVINNFFFFTDDSLIFVAYPSSLWNSYMQIRC